MELLQAGVDCSVIAMWLGHESIETTQTYLHAHLALKEAALAKLKPYQGGNRTRFRPNDRLLAFLAACRTRGFPVNCGGRSGARTPVRDRLWGPDHAGRRPCQAPMGRATPVL